MGVKSGDHLNLSDASTLEKLMDAITRGEQGRDPYSHDMLAHAVQQRLALDGNRYAPANHSVSTNTTVHVAPGPNAKDTAKHVGDEQARVNEELLRNFLPRVN